MKVSIIKYLKSTFSHDEETMTFEKTCKNSKGKLHNG